MTSNKGDPDDGAPPRPFSDSASAMPSPPPGLANAAAPIAKFYKPDVYRYKCRGALHLGDGHPNDDDSGLPLCRGLQSKLRHVATLPPVLSREEAVRKFERDFAPPPPVPFDDDEYDGKGVAQHNDAASPPVEGDDHRESLSCYGTTEVSVLALQESTVSANPSPLGHPLAGVFGPFGLGSGGSPLSMIDDAFKDLHDPSGGGHQRGSVMRSTSSSSTRDPDGNWVTTKETTVVDADGKRKTTVEKTVKKVDGTVETTVKESDDGERSRTAGEVQDVAKGATVVDAPTATRGRPEIAAIAPECRFGLTVSTVEDKTRGNTIGAVRVGPVEVVFTDNYDILENGYEEAVVPDPRRAKDAEGGEDGDPETGRQTPNRQPDDGTQDFSKRFLSSLERTGENVKKNANLIKEGLSDDFPSRFAKSGEKIVGNLGKTLERTGKLAYEVFKMWGSSDENDNDDDRGDGGRRR